MLGAVHRQGGLQQPLLFFPIHPAIAFRLVPRLDAHPEPVKRRRLQEGRILEAPPVDGGP